MLAKELSIGSRFLTLIRSCLNGPPNWSKVVLKKGKLVEVSACSHYAEASRFQAFAIFVFISSLAFFFTSSQVCPLSIPSSIDFTQASISATNSDSRDEKIGYKYLFLYINIVYF
jgi:hypothetical protein